ncbi:23S rRNA (adenine(2503)-C(2))-methyltransferase RlmN [Aliifodinibius salipaludis]|uniref:Probable dual-specificity RNA methyltransferase RlmN n=1 Tax=Fodinibius salipaludis TaxID=2032627 RepID=A0A2A2G8M3_9BACT|nr:23S rRNA (adenine(2503)-C(2))-methyltransferase RlmN [Aliifodinibius salipaludis]PAU93658.1 23S rRNA (adenine(2503)-C(2))-methyltransferase RlmN [Aliifodinibius salipaludis]
MTIQTDTDEKTNLKSLTKEELQEFTEELGLQSFRSDQLFQWLYQKGVHNFDEMTNLSKDLRSRLKEIAKVPTIEYATHQESEDGTMKFLFKLQGEKDHKVEAVLIPDFYEDGAANRLTVCVSSQVGCVFGCSFCATGKMGFFRSLTHGEIVDQVQYIDALCEERFGKGITNIVYMGMGEPLHNYKAVVNSANIITDELSIGLSPKRITVSTVGLTKQIKKLADERQPFNLAISLHAANDEKRDEIMPINNSMGLDKLKEAVQHYYDKLHRPITYEYLLFDEFNDSPEDAQQLADIVQWAPSKVNIIMYNDVAGVALKRAREQRLDAFMQELVSRNVTATVRRSRGDDIDAGCGQLAIKEGQPMGKTIRKN